MRTLISIPQGASLNGTILKSRSRNLSSVETQRLLWLWQGRFACGKLNMLAGDPGHGKSTVTLDIAARTTIGACWPDGQANIAGDVILLSAEDDPGDTIKPRFEAAGGNSEKCHIFEATLRYDAESDKENESFFSLSSDLDALKELIEHTQARLVIIDPISAYLGGVDSHKNAEIRSILGPLANMASETGCCILAVSHLNKSTASAQYRVMGSLAFSAAARSTWVTAKDKDNPARRLLLPVKNNLAPDTGGLAYSIQPSEYNPQIPCVSWEREPVHVSAEIALAPASDDSGKMTDVIDWLRNILDSGPVEANEIKRLANESGIASWRTINEAKKQMGIKTFCDGSPRHGGKWKWELKSANFKDEASLLTPIASLSNDKKTPF